MRWRALGRTLARDRRGGISIIVALGLPCLLGFTAFAVDFGLATVDARRLQGIADAAAIAAASDPGHAQSLAESVVTDTSWHRPITVAAQPGSYALDTTITPAKRFTANASSPDSVRVTLNTTSPSFFALIFGLHGMPIARSAIGSRRRYAAFSIGTRLAALQGGLANALLSGLTGSTVSLSVMDYNALASADIDLFSFLDALRTTAHVQAADYDTLLHADVTTGQALGALATTLDTTDSGAAAAVRTLASQVTGVAKVPLAKLIDTGPMANLTEGGVGLVHTNALDLIDQLIQGASPGRQVSLDLGATIPGLTSTRLIVAIGEHSEQSPWLAITDTGTPVVRTAQARIYLDTTLAAVSLPSIGSLVAIRVPLYVELASAEARLKAIDCSSIANRSVTIEARPSPGQAAIASVDTTKLQDFTTPLALSSARLVHALLIDVDGLGQIDLGATEAWQPLRFNQAAIDAGTIQTISSGALVGGIAASLAGKTTLTPKVLGLPIPLAPLLSAVSSQLAKAAPGLDSLLDGVTGLLGIHLGQADVRVTGVRCGTPALVQ